VEEVRKNAKFTAILFYHFEEPSSVQADVYVWRYALLVVHARKEDFEGLMDKERCNRH